MQVKPQFFLIRPPVKVDDQGVGYLQFQAFRRVDVSGGGYRILVGAKRHVLIIVYLDFDKIVLSFQVNQGVGNLFVQASADKLGVEAGWGLGGWRNEVFRVPVEGASDKGYERRV
jgi:hypothetical protein